MRSRVLGAVLFGLGVLALVFAAGLAFVVAPKVQRLPYDMELTQTVAEAPNATFLQIANGAAKVNSGTLRSTVTVQPDVKATADLEGPLDGNAVVWLVGQEVVRTDTNERISAYSTSLAIDRRTAAAQHWDKQWLDTGNERQSVDYAGQIYKFPFGTEKKTYDIFDRDLLGTRPAQFVKTEQIDGLETYQFTQEIRDEKQQGVPADRLQVLLAQLLPGSTSGEIRYNNTRSVWVEPTTGQFVKVQEQQNKALVGNDGRSVTILDAVFTYTDDTVKKAADTSASNRRRLMLVSVYGPVGLAVLGVILLVLGALLPVRRPGTAGAGPRHAAPESSDPDGDGAQPVSSSADTPSPADPARAETSGS